MPPKPTSPPPWLPQDEPLRRFPELVISETDIQCWDSICRRGSSIKGTGRTLTPEIRMTTFRPRNRSPATKYQRRVFVCKRCLVWFSCQELYRAYPHHFEDVQRRPPEPVPQSSTISSIPFFKHATTRLPGESQTSTPEPPSTYHAPAVSTKPSIQDPEAQASESQSYPIEANSSTIDGTTHHLEASPARTTTTPQSSSSQHTSQPSHLQSLRQFPYASPSRTTSSSPPRQSRRRSSSSSTTTLNDAQLASPTRTHSESSEPSTPVSLGQLHRMKEDYSAKMVQLQADNQILVARCARREVEMESLMRNNKRLRLEKEHGPKRKAQRRRIVTV
ncbi:hypothetical protein BJ508DRAFT_300893 [Ascobolus immersus RN42]|uniref:Uncharacterized protein n=1 Tax=Ascobolus immersus RN42 TaxID=1160509 RepID=A0A3N4IP03_ASCIM|nr:hypothetical protein BJ508DRAFT_300893 [Ascobolus immersus RN42]